MYFLALDLGTTHMKAAVVGQGGEIVAVHQLPSPALRTGRGFVYDPEDFWQKAVTVLQKAGSEAGVPISACGITGMAETGLLVDADTLTPRSSLIPWFDQEAQGEIDFVAKLADPAARFCATGLRLNGKYGLLKILQLKRQGVDLKNSLWLSAIDYIAMRLTGKVGTDPTLAARTYVYSLVTEDWDHDLIHKACPEVAFPPILPSGAALWECKGEGPLEFLRGVPVCICGHDHVVASLAVGDIASGDILNSMGTAEVLLGAQRKAPLTERHYASGLSFGPHVLPGYHHWLGGLSDSGGSIEWVRRILSEPELTYAQLEELLAQASYKPSGIIYHPFLSGSGAPWPDPFARGAVLGLSRSHTRKDLVKAVFEGVAMHMEMIRREAQGLVAGEIRRILVVGGGARNKFWLQTKANVFGRPLTVLQVTEAALVGAGLFAGVGCGLLTLADLKAAAENVPGEVILPDEKLHQEYQWFLEEGYVKLQQPLREYYGKLARRDVCGS